MESLTGVVYDDLMAFELDMDALREGDPWWLYKYYGVEISLDDSPELPRLANSYSEAELLKYEAFADELKLRGYKEKGDRK